MRTSNTFEAAATWLEGHTWCQGRLYAYDDDAILDKPSSTHIPAYRIKGGCMMGAIMKGADRARANSNEAIAWAEKKINTKLNDFNDAPKMTKREVIRTLRELASEWDRR